MSLVVKTGTEILADTMEMFLVVVKLHKPVTAEAENSINGNLMEMLIAVSGFVVAAIMESRSASTDIRTAMTDTSFRLISLF